MENTLILHKEILPFLSISLYLNHLTPLKDLYLENTSEDDTAEIKVHITSDIPCIESFTSIISCVLAKSQMKISLETLRINREYLTSLSETEKANLKISIFESEKPVISEFIEIKVHPIEYFTGFSILPELVASYITPNHAYVYHIKRRAIELLEKQGLRTAFEGYQSENAERILQLMSAIFTAIQNEDIVYSSLPPSYEQKGQRLRLLTTIQREKFGNCIDISLMFAACLEAIDLNPIIVVTQGHAFVGCWLYDNKFAEIVNDDKTAITKRLAKGIREMAVVESTTVCKGNNIDFTTALNIAEAHLIEKDDFILSVDVKRARTAGIRPLPLVVESSEIRIDDTLLTKHVNSPFIDRFEIGTIYTDDELNIPQTKTKQKIWERKLLDLSLRNNLLNMRMTRNMLQIIDIDISQLEDTLADGRSFTILPQPQAEIQRKYNIFAQALHHSSPLYQSANDELKYNRLLTYYHQEDLNTILHHIHKNANLAIEENGSSTLYLAVGLLKWYDRKTPQQPRYSPILLIPVEINRRSVNSNYTLKSREEETMMNITLLEFLRQEYELNITALDNLPYDDKGVDVPKVMGIIRRAVMQLKGWDVEEQLVLGNFSFSKLILWKDMTLYSEKLLESGIVRSLTEGKLTKEVYSEINPEIDFDTIHPSALALPIPTDVSQMNAVLSAQNGKSFILHGPPGTGKSQTITNIIADALFQNKRVLFVAAKKAALDVVYTRLGQIGLAPFSLELHSNKSKKSDVLNQLSDALEVSRNFTKIDFEHEAERLNNAKKAISKYVEALHEKHLSGWSLYDSIVELESLKSENLSKNFIPEDVLQQLSPILWQQWEDWLTRFQSIATQITHPSENPFALFQIHNFSPQVTDELFRTSPMLLSTLRKSKDKTTEFLSEIGFPSVVETAEQRKSMIKIAQLLKELPNTGIDFCQYFVKTENRIVTDEWVAHFRKYQKSLESILSGFNQSIFQMDINITELEWKQAQQQWFLPKLLKKKKIKKQLELHKKSKWESDLQVVQFFEQFRILEEENQFLKRERFNETVKSLQSLYREDETEITEIEKRIEILKQIAVACRSWYSATFANWMQQWREKGLEYSDDINQHNALLINNYLSVENELQDQITEFRTLTGLDLLKIVPKTTWLNDVTMLVERINNHLPQWNTWMNYSHVVREGNELHLHWFTNDFINGVFTIENSGDYFRFTVHQSLARNIIARQESLHLFNTGLFENKIEQYKKIATQYREITCQQLLLKLVSKIPNPSFEAMQSSEIGILQRAIRNRGRGMSIRRLFDQIPTLLPRIAPCMLMSPISVAQYFDVSTEHFDLVIFDEASQLPTCEAVSALARAKQAIIVGDPKQMPPTSFFSTTKIDEENIEIEDLESILDDCLALSIPSLYLLRHYRSKHESLIAFSNANYYENKLLTFPSADDINRKLHHHSVNGYYDKGKTRQNKFEAEAIVKFIQNHYKDPNKRKLSLGVVTFSQAQQNLVEELVYEAFSLDAQLEQAAMECSEPLFIKNLENVQGDERDIILFSVCYAPDNVGKMSMNFGPLNRNGGWRRLNVAVTRSRYEMHVFSTLRSDQIDLSRTSSEGVAGLKLFLQYAETGRLTVLSENIRPTEEKRKSLSGFISEKLNKRGLKTRCNIGSSDFKVDIGIIHPEKQSEYILGILLDGKYYFDAKTTNDREMVMPSVLRVLGWNIYRIWTMDWVENADKIIDNIVGKVEELKDMPIVDESIDKSSEEFDLETVKSDMNPHEVSDFEHVASASTAQISYDACILMPVSNGFSESFYEYQNRNFIKQQISDVINQEAPISKNLLFRRVLQSWNIFRIGSRLDAYLQELTNELDFVKVFHHQPFYWTNEVMPNTLKNYRSNIYEKRSMEDIAPEELVVAIEEAIHQSLSINEDELFRFIASRFGFSKVGKNIDELLRYAVNLAVDNGKIRRENGRIGVK